MTASPDPRQPPSPGPERRVRRRHVAARTRRGLAVGTALATAGLTGAYWIGDLGAATTVTSTASAGASTSSEASSVSRSNAIATDDNDDVGLSASATAPVTSSHAS